MIKMEKLLENKSILITGGGRGIGKAIAEKCASEGADIVIGDIDEQTAEATAKELTKEYGVKAVGLKSDVTKREDCEKLALAAKDLGEGKIGGLVNNAGITMDSTLKKMGDEKWDAVIAVNLKGVYLSTQTAIQYMEGGGSVVNISSIVGKIGNFGQTNYATTKAGVVGFTKALAKEYARKNIRSNAIQPGFIRTPMVEKMPEKVITMMVNQIPMQKMGESEHIADAVVFLLSDKAAYITGSVLEVTGGFGM
jgi:NAD(P)-dependent dehydrogenase (short-subunit alcohol dehydrogenase family)